MIKYLFISLARICCKGVIRCCFMECVYKWWCSLIFSFNLYQTQSYFNVSSYPWSWVVFRYVIHHLLTGSSLVYILLFCVSSVGFNFFSNTSLKQTLLWSMSKLALMPCCPNYYRISIGVVIWNWNSTH